MGRKLKRILTDAERANLRAMRSALYSKDNRVSDSALCALAVAVYGAQLQSERKARTSLIVNERGFSNRIARSPLTSWIIDARGKYNGNFFDRDKMYERVVVRQTKKVKRAELITNESFFDAARALYAHHLVQCALYHYASYHALYTRILKNYDTDYRAYKAKEKNAAIVNAK